MEKHIILHNIRSAHNVGSIFRTADGAGVKSIFLAGYTPAPIDRFGRVHQEIKKTALGATETVSWESWSDILVLIRELQSRDFLVVAVEQCDKAEDYRNVTFQKHVVFVFGNEVDGLSEDILVQADCVVEIPMHGKKESLNVAVAAGIALFNTQ